MTKKSLLARLMLLVLLVVPGLGLTQAPQEKQTLIVNGRPGEAPVIQLNGRSYVDLEALARVVNGSLAFQGNQITLTLPASTVDSQVTDPSPSPPAHSEISRDFMRAAIEEMAVIREWRSALANAVQNSYPVTENWVATYRGQAATNLKLALVGVVTDSDGKALQLLKNEFENMQRLSNRFVAAHTSMSYTPADALKNDPLDQKVLSCARSMASMAASSQFVDDGSCY